MLNAALHTIRSYSIFLRTQQWTFRFHRRRDTQTFVFSRVSIIIQTVEVKLSSPYKHTHTTYVNMRSALSFRTGVGAFAHWKRNWRNSGHWLFPSSSIRLRATSAATSQTFLRIESDSSCCTASSTCSFSCCCPSGDSCKLMRGTVLHQYLLKPCFQSHAFNNDFQVNNTFIG